MRYLYDVEGVVGAGQLGEDVAPSRGHVVALKVVPPCVGAGGERQKQQHREQQQ